MKAIFIITIFILSFTQSYAKVKISKRIFEKVQFSDQFMESGALIRNVHYFAVNELVDQLESLYNLKLTDRGEAHITVITPPEGQGSGAPSKNEKGINFFISAPDIVNLYKNSLQNTTFDIVCVGRLVEGHKTVFYLVIESKDLFMVRNDINTRSLEIANKQSKKLWFKPNNYYPHITIGFVGGDIHNKSKGPETCVQDLEWID